MKNMTLSMDYMLKAKARLKILPILYDEKDYPDVVRVSQEIVELSLKAILRHIGIDPPKWHDVGGILLDNIDVLPTGLEIDWDEIAQISKWLRKEREMAFYGAVDYIPMLEYNENIAQKAMDDAKKVFDVAKKIVTI